ncbi:MAG: hypothetical protein RIR90_318, partial [Bacteroidota bacterium]
MFETKTFASNSTFAAPLGLQEWIGIME